MYFKKSNGPAQGDEIDIEIDGEKSRGFVHTYTWGLSIDDRLSSSKHVDTLKSVLIYRRFKTSVRPLFTAVFTVFMYGLLHYKSIVRKYIHTFFTAAPFGIV